MREIKTEPDDSMYRKERVIDVDVGRLIPFKDHPFKVKEDESMFLLMESIGRNGIMIPLVVIPAEGDKLQIISGHRRKYCAEKLGIKQVPVIIRSLSVEESIIEMVDSNVYRDNISYRERSFAYKMKNDAMKRRAGRKKNSPAAMADEIRGKRTMEIIGKENRDSARQVMRYIRLTKLIPELLEKLDKGEMSFNPAVNISFLTEEEQYWVLDGMDYTQAVPSVSQSKRMKELSQKRCLTRLKIRQILGEVKMCEMKRVSFKNEQIYKFFPKEYSVEQIKTEILDLLEQVYGK